VIDRDEYNLLVLLQSNPNISYTEIAQIFKFSPATAKRKVVELRKKGLYYGKYALFRPTTVGLNKYVILSFTDKAKNLETIERALREHPYTSHRSRIYVPRLGIYSEFNYPSEDPSLLKEFFEELKKRRVIYEYKIYKSTHIERNLSLNLKKISLDTLQWDFDWQVFRNKLNKIETATFPVPAESILSSMKLIDFKILRILTNDADISQRELSRRLKSDRTEVWRRIHFLEENVISGYKAKIDRKKFNITSNKIIFLHFKDDVLLWTYFSLFSNEEIRPPFRYRLEILQDSKKRKILLIYISLPQHHEAQLFYFINDDADVESYSIDPVGKHGVRYSFYEPNFDSKKREWKLSKQYVVSNPIEKTFKKQ